jgi:hypothetical protein
VFKVSNELCSKYYLDSIDASSDHERPIIINALMVKYNWAPGSIDSIKFHEELAADPNNLEAYKTDLIQ